MSLIAYHARLGVILECRRVYMYSPWRGRRAGFGLYRVSKPGVCVRLCALKGYAEGAVGADQGVGLRTLSGLVDPGAPVLEL